MSYVRVGPNTLSARRAAGSAAAAAPGATTSTPYQVAIVQRDPPQHGIIANLHDKPPTPSAGGGGWEEIQLPRRSAVLIWRGRGLMKLTLSLLFDSIATGETVVTSDYRTLLHFWRPEGDTSSGRDYSTIEPPVLTLQSPGNVIPYANLPWIISNLEWGDSVGGADGARVQQVLSVEFTEFKADERLKTAAQKKKGRPTKPYTTHSGDTLAKLARKYGITPSELGALQKPPIRDGRHLPKKIVVPDGWARAQKVK